MTPDLIAQLVINVGLAGALVIYFVWRDGKRQIEEGKVRTELEKFIRETLITMIAENQELVGRCIGVIEAIESK